jgi:DnaJ-class molecular chaperone
MADDKTPLKTKTHKDYYQILRVKPDATADQIQSAYCVLYERYGPNAPLDSWDSETLARMFTDVKDAYEVLSNPVKRQDYDRNLALSRKQTGDVRALWTKVAALEPGPAPDAIPTQVQALSLEVTVEVTMKEAVKGTKRTLDITDPTPCQDCAGMKPVTRMQCTTCRGLTYFNVDRKEEIELSPGMYEGMEIRKSELGRYDLRAHTYGDLVLKIKVKAHPFLSLSGKDVTCTVPVTVYEALLGAEIEVPTATGRVMMKIQALTQPGRVYRLKGLGLGGGDQLVAIELVLPQSLSTEELAMYRKLKELYKEPNPRNKRFPK